MNTPQLKKLVKDEATKLKANANKKEIAKLSFETLRTASITDCIYGQMTGDCFSDRATDLIKLSCERVFTRTLSGRNVEGRLNGSPKESYRSQYWSPIEVFIDMSINKINGNNKRLIAYLKGETETLRLKTK